MQPEDIIAPYRAWYNLTGQPGRKKSSHAPILIIWISYRVLPSLFVSVSISLNKRRMKNGMENK